MDLANLKYRYSLFLVLYPVGIGSEWWLMFQATTAATHWAVLGLYYFFLGLYVPGMFNLLFDPKFLSGSSCSA